MSEKTKKIMAGEGAAFLLTAVSCLLLLLISAVMVKKELLPANLGKAYIIASVVISSALGTMLLTRFIEAKKAAAALINGLTVAAIYIFIVILTDGAKTAFSILYQIMCIAAGSITGCIAGTVNFGKRKSR